LQSNSPVMPPLRVSCGLAPGGSDGGLLRPDPRAERHGDPHADHLDPPGAERDHGERHGDGSALNTASAFREGRRGALKSSPVLSRRRSWLDLLYQGEREVRMRGAAAVSRAERQVLATRENG
jgi:hypothetical protein